MIASMFNKISRSDIEKLQEICGAENVVEDIGEDYSHDELGSVICFPDVLVKVRSTDDISAVMKLANERSIPVTVRGSGTGLVGAAVATEGGILMETTAMNQILELDEDNLTLTVQPGVLLMDIAAYAIEHGFLYPPDPGEKTATIGGNISTNAGGMRAIKYGVTRDYVRGLTVVLPDGNVLKLGGKVVKNSSGYSLKDLIIGSEGTLAVIAEAILKLVPLPAVSVSMLAPFNAMEGALDAVPKIIRSKAAPVAIEYFTRDTIRFAEDYLGKRFPDTRYPAYLLLTFDGNSKDYVDDEFTRTADLCLELGAEDVYIIDTIDRIDTVWKARGSFLEAIKASTDEMDECDVVVPRNRVAEYIKFSHSVAEDVGMRIPYFGHAGDGNLHLYLCRDGIDEKLWQEKLAKAFDQLFKKAAEFGGLPSGEHGIGYAKKQNLLDMAGPEQVSLMAGIKKVFDRNGILNPGKIFD